MPSALAPLAALSAQQDRKNEPLAYYECASWQAEWIYEHIGECEIYLHAANKFGKSTLAAALAVAWCEGKKELGGVTIPTVEGPVTGAIGTPSFKLGEGSIIGALRALLGNWPNHEERTAGSASVIYIKHRSNRDSDDYRKWSKLYIFPYEGPEPEAVRLDFWIADEPPPTRWISAIRNRGKRGRKLHGLITATPIDSREWEPIKKQYPDQHMVIVNGRVRIQAPVYDNRFLNAQDIHEAEQSNIGDPWAKARLLGEHVNAEGSNPFDPNTLQRWLDACRDPDQRIELVVNAERDKPSGRVTIPVSCTFDIWGEVDPHDVYIVLVDPARGINDGKHDPDGLHVWSRRKRAQVGRVSHYLGGWGLGLAAVEAGKAFNNAKIYVLRGGGYGESVFSAIRTSGYRHLGELPASGKRRETFTQLGVVENAQARAEAMTAVQDAMVQGSCTINSADTVKCLMRCIVDETGKIVGKPGDHDEDLVLTGYALRICASPAGAPAVVREDRPLTSAQNFDRAFERTNGRPRRPRAPIGPSDNGRWTR
jgi:hypothetical protein